MNVRTQLLAVVSAGTITAFAGTAGATTINSFLNVSNVTGITVSPSVQSPTLNYAVTLNAGATFTYNSVTYTITDVIGFYLLAPGYNDGAQGALAGAGGFADDSDHRGAGSIYGWKSNPNSGITSGNSQAFAYSAINYAQYSQIGFHVRLSGTFPGTDGNTGNITGALTPTPGAAAVLGMAGLAGFRRRR
jgi:hypothetical protein